MKTSLTQFLSTFFLFLVLVVLLFGFCQYTMSHAMRSQTSFFQTKLEDSGIQGQEIVIDEKHCPYYTVLTKKQKKIYKQMVANILEYKESFIPVTNVTTKEVNFIYDAVLFDHPEFFWIGDSFEYKHTSSGLCKQITIRYNGLQDSYEENRNILEENILSILQGVNIYSTDYEKEKYIHDILLEQIDYVSNASYHQTAFSALVNHETVCAGYARAFQLLMNRLGILTYYVEGTRDGEKHAWNIVKLDEEYYNVDLTLDDTLSYSYTYFNKTDRALSSEYSRSTISRLLPKCSATFYDYETILSNEKR